jgi:hypothetical protein
VSYLGTRNAPLPAAAAAVGVLTIRDKVLLVLLLMCFAP